jgi:transposase
VDTGTFAVEESTMGKSRRKYPAEFRRQVVELARTGRSAEDLAREFGASRESIRLWVLAADREQRARAALTPDERAELERLRRENRQLRVERDILSKATAWFARETTGIPPKDSGS